VTNRLAQFARHGVTFEVRRTLAQRGAVTVRLKSGCGLFGDWMRCSQRQQDAADAAPFTYFAGPALLRALYPALAAVVHAGYLCTPQGPLAGLWLGSTQRPPDATRCPVRVLASEWGAVTAEVLAATSPHTLMPLVRTVSAPGVVQLPDWWDGRLQPLLAWVAAIGGRAAVAAVQAAAPTGGAMTATAGPVETLPALMQPAPSELANTPEDDQGVVDIDFAALDAIRPGSRQVAECLARWPSLPEPRYVAALCAWALADDMQLMRRSLIVCALLSAWCDPSVLDNLPLSAAAVKVRQRLARHGRLKVPARLTMPVPSATAGVGRGRNSRAPSCLTRRRRCRSPWPPRRLPPSLRRCPQRPQPRPQRPRRGWPPPSQRRSLTRPRAARAAATWRWPRCKRRYWPSSTPTIPRPPWPIPRSEAPGRIRSASKARRLI